MKRQMEGIPRKEVALTFHSVNEVIHVQDYSFLDIDYLYVGEKTLVVPADAVERFRRLHPEVNEVLSVAELPLEEKTTRPREQIIFEASAHRGQRYDKPLAPELIKKEKRGVEKEGYYTSNLEDTISINKNNSFPPSENQVILRARL